MPPPRTPAPPPPLDRGDRERLARKRIRSVLRTYVVASERTLEAKISDAGPFGQRIDPHILTRQLRYLRNRGEVAYTAEPSGRWYFLTASSEPKRSLRLRALIEVQSRMDARPYFHQRLGQALEIAVYRALTRSYSLPFFGAFTDLADHGDDQLYSKEEPPASSGHAPGIGTGRVDFLLTAAAHGLAAVEVKNTRPWIYPGHDEVRDLLRKASTLDAVPALVARRLHFLTFQLLHACGGIVHQVYNQRYPAAEADLAQSVKDKHLLGYFDVRLGNEPDERLLRFTGINLPRVLPRARAKFNEHKDLIQRYTRGSFSFKDLRQALGLPEED